MGEIKYSPLIDTDDEVLPQRQRDPKCCVSRIPPWFKTELREQIEISWPMVLTVQFQFALTTVALLFTGQLGTTVLAGHSMAISMINSTVLAPSVGLSSACDTIFSQIYGTSRKKEIGVHLQRCLIVMTLYCFPFWALHLNMESLLLLAGQPTIVAQIAGEYLLLFTPAVLFIFLYSVLSRYLMSQNKARPLIVIGLISNGIVAGCHYLFINVLQLGIRGSAIALNCGYGSMLVMVAIYIVFSREYVETWDGWSFSAFRNWGTFNRLAIPGMMMVVFEWCALELSAILAGWIDEVQVAVQVMAMQCCQISYNLYFGIALAVSVRVGHALGAGDDISAKRATRASIFLAVTCCLFCALFFLSMKGILPSTFSGDIKVIEAASSVFTIISPYQIFVGISVIYAGILRGCGKQHIGAGFYFLTYYGIIIPVGASLMLLTNLKVAGFWFGMLIGQVFAAVIFVSFVQCINWKKEISKVNERTGIKSDVRSYGSTASADELGGISYSDNSISTGWYDRVILVVIRLLTIFAAVAVLVTAIFTRIYAPVPNFSGNNFTFTTLMPKIK